MNKEKKYVSGNLVATYDLTPTYSQSFKNLDYLCVYEYEYEGKKYKYRTHQRDNFAPVPETIQLVITKDPSKAIKVNNSTENQQYKKSSSFGCGLIAFAIVIFAIYAVYSLIKTLIDSFAKIKFEFNIIYVFIFVVIVLLNVIAISKARRKQSNRDAEIEDAILNNRVVNAQLKKSVYVNFTNFEHGSANHSIYKSNPYEGIYTYEYNGKKYTIKYGFDNTPPSVITLYLGKKAKDIIYCKY